MVKMKNSRADLPRMRYISVLQCVAVCCNVLQCAVRCRVLQGATGCYSVSQCGALYSSVLQCVALCYSVLQCVSLKV